jgi:hypothetical protein
MPEFPIPEVWYLTPCEKGMSTGGETRIEQDLLL